MPQGAIIGFPLELVVRVAQCEWSLTQSKGDRDPDFEVSYPVPPRQRPFNAWELRNDFLAVKTVADLLRFLNHTGSFDLGTGPRSAAVYWEFQRLLREMMRQPPARWHRITRNFRPVIAKWAGERNLMSAVKFHVREKLPVAVVEIFGAFQGMVASIWVDHLRGIKFGICQRPDCGTAYTISSGHKRKYCSYDCAHIEQVRRSRRDKAKFKRR